MLKMAYQQGLETALQEAGLEKEAFWGALARGVGKAGSGLWKGLSAVTPGGGGTLGFGLLGGGMGALSADPGERMSGFGKGLLGGLIGGAGWHYGEMAGKGLLRGLTNTKFMTKRAPKLTSNLKEVMGFGKFKKQGPIGWGDLFSNEAIAAKRAPGLLGAKTLAAVPVMGGAFALSGAAEDAAHKHVPWLHQPETAGYRDVPRYMAVAHDVLKAPRLGMTPAGASLGASSGTMPGASTW